MKFTLVTLRSLLLLLAAYFWISAGLALQENERTRFVEMMDEVMSGGMTDVKMHRYEEGKGEYFLWHFVPRFAFGCAVVAIAAAVPLLDTFPSTKPMRFIDRPPIPPMQHGG